MLSSHGGFLTIAIFCIIMEKQSNQINILWWNKKRPHGSQIVRVTENQVESWWALLQISTSPRLTRRWKLYVLFCCALLGVLSNFAIILKKKRLGAVCFSFLICLLDVLLLWMFCGSSSWCCGFSGLQCMIVVFPNLLSQIINPTRPAPAVESLAKGTMGSAPPTRNCYTRHFNVNTKTCKGGDFNFVFFFWWRCSSLLFLWCNHFTTYSFCKSMFISWWLQQQKPVFDF